MKKVSRRMTKLSPAIVYMPYYSFDCITTDVKPAIGGTGPWSWKPSVFSCHVSVGCVCVWVFFALFCGNLCTLGNFYCIFIVMNE